MTVVDGPTLRSLRVHHGVPLRRIARVAGMSHGHLSKVERGEIGRPVTPAVMNAYQRVLGLDIEAVLAGQMPPEQVQGWRPGTMNDFQRQAFTSQVGTLSVGGHATHPRGRMLRLARPTALPSTLSRAELASLHQIAGRLRDLDGLAGLAAHALLCWLLQLPSIDDPTNQEVNVVIAQLARRAARDALDHNRHDTPAPST